jgi:metallophosphoesterase (TIGR03767 family)
MKRRALITAIWSAALFGCAFASVAGAEPFGKTTLTETIWVPQGSPFRQVAVREGEPYVTRQGPLGRARPKRARTRRSVVFFAQFSDTHITDPMTPARVDFVDAAGPPLGSSWRPQEALGTQVLDQVVRNVNANRTSPVRGAGGKRARLGFAITTGDNIDNQQLNEAQWFARALEGGRLDPFSGKPVGPGNECSNATDEEIAALNASVAERRYTGIQDYGDYPNAPSDRYDAYWDPNQAPPGTTSPYAAFPRYPGLMNRALAPFDAEGLRVPYFVSRGNHDGEIQGNIAATFPLARALINGCRKILPNDQFDPASIRGLSEEQLIERFGDPAFQQQLLAGLRLVPPDPDRRFVSAAGLRQVFANAAKQAGYGFVARAERRASDGAASYYAFTQRGVRFIALDTVSDGGSQHGNIDNAQYRWLVRELDRNSRVELRGRRVVLDRGDNRLIVLYGHHSLDSMTSTATDESAGACASAADEPGCDRDPRRSTPLHRGEVGRANLRDLLHRYPNAIAYVNGHRHANRIRAYPRRDRRAGFWEVNTASHIDFPQQARLVEIADNRDGTLSLFATLVDSAAPIAPPAPGPADAFDSTQLASLSRVLSANDPQEDPVARSGRRVDRNAELLIRDPRALAPRRRR